MTVKKWIFSHIARKGASWVAGNYDLCSAECENKVSRETYSRYIRQASELLRERTTMFEPVETDHDERPYAMQSHDVATVDDAIQYHRFNLAEYEIKKVRVNTWGSAKNANKQVSLEGVRRPGAFDFLAEIEQMKREAESFAPVYPEIVRHTECSGNMLELNVPDIHLGQHSWGKETGTDWDVKITRDTFLDAVYTTLEAARAYGFEEILFPVGNDFYNSDSLYNATTKGTPQDEDTRWPKTFTVGRQMLTEAIDYMRRFAPVRVVRVPGNHDEQRSFYICALLEAWYRNCHDVTVENSPKSIVYYQWGKCMLGLTHEGKKPEDLILTMATDEPVMWSETEYREIHTAHLHHLQAFERKGIRVITMPSFVALSAWAARQGYRSLRESTGCLWNKEYGKIATLHYHPVRVAA